ncbi:FxSxx-COOH system tetratricopeptide repeat protein [Actinosynnema sp. CS-041913]|uniref:FxSxx-COOH system tetratricopeptide repeat protein n=1 Tax=Actinosynnema sp. CS-041913 TaxID=3239917 RepID=UPI003D8CE5A3
MSITTKSPGWLRHIWTLMLHRPLLVGLGAVTLGVAGLLFNLDRYLAGALVLTVGGLISAFAERGTKRTAPALDEASPAVVSWAAGDEGTTGARVWNIPQPVRTFMGRSAELTRLHRQLSRDSRSVAAVALHGLPGLGKTQLAMAYAERHRDSFDIGWWITASDRLWVVAGLAELARRLGVARADQEQELAAQAAVSELGQRGRWLLVFDDAAEQSTLAGLIPNGEGQVVITSRNPVWDTVADTTEVPSLRERDAVKLLLAHSGDTDTTAASALAAELHGLPLAVAQAGTYCRFRAVTLADYHHRFLESQARLMAEGTAGPYPVPAAVTVGLAVEQLLLRNVAAVQLLRMLAFLAPVATPRDLPTYGCSVLPRELALAARDPLGLDDLVEALVGTSLVSLDQPGFIRTHSLVQAIVRDAVRHRRTTWPLRLARLFHAGRDSSADWTETHWADCVGAVLERAFPDDPGDLQVWSRCAALSTHVDAYITHATRLTGDAVILDAVSSKIVTFLHDRGEYAAAQEHCERILSNRVTAHGPDHPSLLAPTHQLGLMAYRRGEFLRARSLFLQVTSSARIIRGHDHMETLGAELWLSFVLCELGELDYAKQLAERALAILVPTSGQDHPKTLRAKATLAFVMSELSTDRGEVLDHFTQAYEGHLRRFGLAHRNTLRAWHNLCRAQAEAGKFDEAKAGLQVIIENTMDTYGLHHPFSLFAQHNLARAFWLEGVDLSTARTRFENVLATRRRTIGADHPKTLTTCHYLARVLAKQGHTTAAEHHLRTVIEARTRTLGADNPQTLLAHEDLARLMTDGTTSLHGQDAARRLRPDLASAHRRVPDGPSPFLQTP